MIRMYIHNIWTQSNDRLVCGNWSTNQKSENGWSSAERDQKSRDEFTHLIWVQPYHKFDLNTQKHKTYDGWTAEGQAIEE